MIEEARGEAELQDGSSGTSKAGSTGWALLRWLIVSYKCQSLAGQHLAPSSRLWQIQSRHQADFICSQGTKLSGKYRADSSRTISCWKESRPQAEYATWYWRRPGSASRNGPRGLCISVRQSRKLRRALTQTEEPDDPELQGPVGLLRLRKRGAFDLACFNVYLSGGHARKELEVRSHALAWLTTQLRHLPSRCLPLVCADANARLGSLSACDRWGNELIGREGAQEEGPAGRQLREFLTAHSLRAVNTMSANAAGPTWAWAWQYQQPY